MYDLKLDAGRIHVPEGHVVEAVERTTGRDEGHPVEDGIVHVELSVQSSTAEESTGMLHGCTAPVAVLATSRTIASLSRSSRPLRTDVSYYGNRGGLCTRIRHVPSGTPFHPVYCDGGDCRTDLRAAFRASLREEESATKALPIFMDGLAIVGTEIDMENTFRQFNKSNTVAIVLGKEFVRCFNETFCTVEPIDLSSPDLDVAKRSLSPIQRCVANAWRDSSRPPVYLAQSQGQVATLLYGQASRSNHAHCKYMVEALANDHIVGFYVDAGEASARIDSASKKLIVSMAEKHQTVLISYIKTSVGGGTLVNTENEAEEAVPTDSLAPTLCRTHDWFQDATPKQVVRDIVALAQKMLGVTDDDRSWSTWGPLLQQLHGWKGTMPYLPFQMKAVQSALDHLQSTLPIPSGQSPMVFREVSQRPFANDVIV